MPFNAISLLAVDSSVFLFHKGSCLIQMKTSIHLKIINTFIPRALAFYIHVDTMNYQGKCGWNLNYLPLYTLDFHVIATRWKLIGVFKRCNNQLLYLVNGGKSFHAYSLTSRCHYFMHVHSCSVLPFYYTFQPTYNLAKALYDTVKGSLAH